MADQKDICSTKSDSPFQSSNSAIESASNSNKNNKKSTSSSSSTNNSSNNFVDKQNENYNNSSSSNIKYDSDGSVDVTPVVDKAKSIIDSFFEPLAGNYNGSSSFNSSLYNAGYNTNSDVTRTEVSYDIVNLDPNNPWDIYYRDDDPVIWESNRKAANMNVNRNIQKIHDTIISKIRERILVMFGDKVTIRVEHCFMGPDAIMKYKLKSNHLFSEARGVVFSVYGEKASFIYEDLKDWCDEKTVNDIKIDDKEMESFDYGMMKLCNTNAEKQMIYITLPFTKEELEKDELLLVNRSNFYYTESNQFMMAPESNTPTKIFPAYKQDNEVEDLFNKIDDLDDEISKVDKEIQYYKKENNKEMVDNKNSEKLLLEKEKENIIEQNDKSDLLIEKETLEELVSKYPTEENKNKLDKLEEKIDSFPSNEDTYEKREEKEEVIKNTINLDLGLDLNATMNIPINGVMTKFLLIDQINDYFKARKLINIYKMIQYFKDKTVEINEEDIESELVYRKSIYDAEKNARREQLYQDKVKELYPNGIPEGSDIPYIEVKESSVDMSDFPEPTKESIISEQENIFNKKIELLKRAYDENDPSLIKNAIYEFNHSMISFTEKEETDICITEYSKFPLLGNLVKSYEMYKEFLNIQDAFNSQLTIKEIFELEDLNELFKILFADKTDYDIVKKHYFDTLRAKYGSPELVEKIKKSMKLSDIFHNKNFNITIIPANSTEDYPIYIMDYLDSEIILATELNDTERLIELNSLKTEYEGYIKSGDYSKMNLSSFKTEIFQFTDIEYDSVKLNMLDEKINDSSVDHNDKLIYKLAYNIFKLKNKTKNMVQYQNSNAIGKNSFLEQCINTSLNKFYNDIGAWITENELNIDVNDVDTDIINDARILDSKLESKLSILHNYMDKYNEFIYFTKYNDDLILEVDIYLNSINKSYNFKDYGFEFTVLHEQIAKLQQENKEENDYMIRLKKDRIILKRELEYIIAKDIDKKIKHYQYELNTAIDFGKVNRFNEINEDIMPELIRLKELKESFIPIDNNKNIYELRKISEKERLGFLYQMDPTNKALLYRYVTSDVSMDFESSRGIFENLNVSKEKKYKMYLEEILKELNKSNSQLLDSEKKQIQKEIDYINNFNNEKEIRKNELINDMRNKKESIKREIEKRRSDKEYLHEKIWSSFYENELKLKYKNYTKIEYLPSTGAKFIYPFYLYEEFKKIYKESMPDIEIGIYECLDSYLEYTKMDFNLFDREYKEFCYNMHKKWIDFKYKPDTNTMTTEINKYIILTNDEKNPNLLEYIYSSLKKINGFMEVSPIMLSDNEQDYNNALLVKIRRTRVSVENDLLLFLTRMFKLDNVDIKVVNKEDIL